MDFSLIKNGDTVCETFSFSNDGTKDATQVTVEFTIPTGFVYDSHSIPYGSFGDHATDSTKKVWTVGILPKGTTVSPIICIRADVDCPTLPACIKGEIKTDFCDTNLTDNIAERIIEGISCCDLTDCANLISYEAVYDIPTTAFAENLNPLNSEVQTWAEANIDLIEREGGTILTYTDKPYTEFNTYQDFSTTASGLGNPGNLIRFKLNGDFIDDPATTFDASSSASFDQAALKAYLEANLTGTATITDDIDGSGEVTVEITSQTGITSFAIVRQDDFEFDTAVTFIVENNFGRTEPSHIWVSNKTTTGYEITEIYKSEEHGSVNYIATTGLDNREQPSDTHKPFKSFVNALNIPNKGTIEIFPGEYLIDEEVELPIIGKELTIYAKPGTYLNHICANPGFQGHAFQADFGAVAGGKLTFISDGNIMTSGTAAGWSFFDLGQILNTVDIQLNKVEVDDGILTHTYAEDFNLKINDITSVAGRSQIIRATVGINDVPGISNSRIAIGNVRFTSDSNKLIRLSQTFCLKGSQNTVIIDDAYIDGVDGMLIDLDVEEYKSTFNIEVKNVLSVSTLGDDSPDFYSTVNKDVGIIYLQETMGPDAVGYVKIGEAKSENVPLIALDKDLLNDNSTLHIKIDNAIVGDYGIIVDTALLNSTLIIDANIKCTGNKPAITLLRSADATSKVIIRGRYETTGAIPVVCIGENYADRVIFENATLINDGTAAPVQTDSVTPIDVLFWLTGTNSVVSDINVNEVGPGMLVSSDLI